MYPPSPPSRDFEVMLGESLSHHIEPNLDNLENNKPSSILGASLSKTRQALLKKGGKKLRSTTSGLQRTHHQQPHQKHHQTVLRNNHTRLSDINNNNVAVSPKSPGQSNAELATNRTQSTVLTHHLKQGTKKELLKSKSGRIERGTTQPGCLSVHSLKHDQAALNVNTRNHRSKNSNAPGSTPLAKKQDSSCQQKPPSPFQLLRREEKKPFNSADNVKIVNVCPSDPIPEEEKIYAGAKFSEPPSPSVLPKPPSHWVGENGPQHSDHNREQMTVHLKSLLKVQDKP